MHGAEQDGRSGPADQGPGMRAKEPAGRGQGRRVSSPSVSPAKPQEWQVGQSGIWFYEVGARVGWYERYTETGAWPLTFKDHHARLGTDPLDPGWPGQVVAVRVTAGPALVSACVLCGEPINRQRAGCMLAVGGMDVNAVQPGAIPELGAGVVWTIPLKPPLDLGNGAAHSLTVQDHAAPRPALLRQWRLKEASYGKGLVPVTTGRRKKRGRKDNHRARHTTTDSISFLLAGRNVGLGRSGDHPA